MNPELIVFGPLLVDEIYGNNNQYLGRFAGGSALYAALAAQLVGVKVGVVAVIGNDFPEEVIQHLQNCDIDLCGVTVLEQPSCKVILEYVDNDRHYRICPQGLDFEKACPTSEQLPASYYQAKGFHISPFIWHKQISELKKIKAHTDATVSLDPVDIIPEDKTESYLQESRYADIFMPSEIEYELFFHNEDIQNSLPKMAKGNIQHVIFKRGPQGAVHYARESQLFYNEPALNNLDIKNVNGAGDSFCGAFHAALIKYQDMTLAMQVATAVASLVIEGSGPEKLLSCTSSILQERLARYDQHS